MGRGTGKREGKGPQVVQPPLGFIVERLRRVAAEGPHPPFPPPQDVPSPWQDRGSSHLEGVSWWVWLGVKRQMWVA